MQECTYLYVCRQIIVINCKWTFKFYIAPLKERNKSEALSALSHVMVNVIYNWTITSVSKITHSKLKEKSPGSSPRIHVEPKSRFSSRVDRWMFRVSTTSCVDRWSDDGWERSQHTISLPPSSSLLAEDDVHPANSVDWSAHKWTVANGRGHFNSQCRSSCAETKGDVYDAYMYVPHSSAHQKDAWVVLGKATWE